MDRIQPWHAHIRKGLSHHVRHRSPLCCGASIVIEPLFNAFATTAFFEFVVFAIFEMRYLLSVWRARRANALDPWAAQRELSVLYARFYGALLGGILLMYQLQGCATYLLL